MKTAIITGASSGLGREFVRQLADVFPDIDCYWLIARRRDRLEEMAEGLPDKTVECLGLDLCDTMIFVALQEKLTAEQPEVTLPKAAYCPSRCLASWCMMKNWEPAELGEEERAMLRTPRLCFRSFLKPLKKNSPLMQ